MADKIRTIALASLVAAMLQAGTARAALGQCPAPPAAAGSLRLPMIGSAFDDSTRLGALEGACWGNSSLLRSSISLSPVDSGRSFRWAVLEPVIEMTRNSVIPDSRNDGALWAGRGANARVIAGARLSAWRVRGVFAPQYVYAENLTTPIKPNGGFPVLPVPDPVTSAFISPWHSGAHSADLPLRFGNAPYARVDLGESFVEVLGPGIALGATTANLWWGPGIRNALVMSNNAAGIPQVYLRTTHPIAIPLARLEAHWLTGGLRESPFFDYDTRNDLRAVSGAAVTLRLNADTGLTIGGERVVYANARRFAAIPAHLADVFLDWHRAPSNGFITDRANESDQLTGLFARWIMPASGLAIHGEWVKNQLPASLRDLFVDIQHQQAFTLGLEWARPVGAGRFRVQLEATTLELTPDSLGQEVHDFYTSHTVRQGYTQEGQVVGASIGPGSSSQFIGATWFHPGWTLGGLLERVRYEDGAYYHSQGGLAYRTHDIGLSAGLHGSLDSRFGAVELSVIRTLRMNYLFQTVDPFLYDDAFNVKNTQLSLRLSPRLR